MSSLSAGGLAGAIVGTAIGAALLAVLLAAYAYTRLRRATRHDGDGGGGVQVCEDQSDGQPPPQPAAYHELLLEADEWKGKLTMLRDQFGYLHTLPWPIEDSTLRDQVRAVLFGIEGLTMNYYGANLDGGDTRRLLAELNVPRLPMPLAQMMYGQPLVVREIIQHCITYLLLAKITPGTPPDDSLLPPQLQVMPDSLEVVETGRGPRDPFRLQSMWRWLNGVLFRSLYAKDTVYQQHCDRITTHFVDTVLAAFAPWEREGQNLRRKLTHFTKLATTLGIDLQSHPATFCWQWEAPTSTDETCFVSRPGLLKTTTEYGKKCEEPTVFFKPEITPMTDDMKSS